jgi:hypothetical protein
MRSSHPVDLVVSSLDDVGHVAVGDVAMAVEVGGFG